ncbi:MAG: hypothetical protein ACRDRJ_02275 [Streptosporangiaceae bacterium]
MLDSAMNGLSAPGTSPFMRTRSLQELGAFHGFGGQFGFWHHHSFSRLAFERGQVVFITHHFLIVRSLDGRLTVWRLTGGTAVKDVARAARHDDGVGDHRRHHGHGDGDQHGDSGQDGHGDHPGQHDDRPHVGAVLDWGGFRPDNRAGAGRHRVRRRARARAPSPGSAGAHRVGRHHHCDRVAHDHPDRARHPKLLGDRDNDSRADGARELVT